MRSAPEREPAKGGLPEGALKASAFKKLKAGFLQFFFVPAIGSVANAAVQSLDPRTGAVDDASEFGAKFRRSVCAQAQFRFFCGKPGGVSIRFLWRFEPCYFAKVNHNRER